MNILLSSPAFLPSLGGLESWVATMAEEWSAQGHPTVVLTETPDPAAARFPYPVVRRPSARARLAWTRWCDVYFQANVSLRGLWPLALVRRPWAVSHHSWYTRTEGHLAPADRLKRFLLRFARLSVAVSQAMADELATTPPRHRVDQVIGNPYRDALFRPRPGVTRERELVFVGRLVSDKGVDVLLAALVELGQRGLTPTLTVIGDGPERAALAAQAAALGSQVRFCGALTGEALAVELHRHEILVVPSRYREPYGIVALEGIACGCVVVGSSGGGLPEAIGPCGRTFPNGDARALAAVLEELLRSPATRARLRLGAEAHLAPRRAAAVAAAYLDALKAAA